MKPRTRTDYYYDIENSDKLNVLTRINKELKLFKEAKESLTGNELLTKTKIKEIKKENKKQGKVKDEITFEQKLKREERIIKKHERKVFGGVYKKSYVDAIDINGVLGFLWISWTEAL